MAEESVKRTSMFWLPCMPPVHLENAFNCQMDAKKELREIYAGKSFQRSGGKRARNRKAVMRERYFIPNEFPAD